MSNGGEITLSKDKINIQKKN